MAGGGIIDLAAPGCANNSTACINPIFGPTRPGWYWSSSTYQFGPEAAWHVTFLSGFLEITSEGNGYGGGRGAYVRAVRGGS